jgi:glycosyltransferase involved in cell wall biosynthesis
MRAALGLADAPLMVYVGKFGGWYMQREMVDFFAVARQEIPRLHFLILTQGDREEIRRELEAVGVGPDSYTITSAPADRVGDYLCASDFAISFIEPVPSKVASSPTKIGEYLAAGLPVASTTGVGDLDSLLTPQVGALINEHTPAAYRHGLAQIGRLLDDPATAGRCRSLARRELSLEHVGIPRYRDLYERVAAVSLVPRRGR